MIKFHAKVNQGKIEIPDYYQNKLKLAKTVEVTISETKTISSGIIRRLIEEPIQISGFTPLSKAEIYER